MQIGYARCSTVEQQAGFEAQLKQLKAVGCNKIFSEQVSAVSSAREQLEAALDFVREGDVLVVAKLDRLARSIADLLTIVHSLEKKNVSLRIFNLGIDTNTPTGKLRKEVAERLEIGEATVYRVLKDAKPENPKILINS